MLSGIIFMSLGIWASFAWEGNTNIWIAGWTVGIAYCILSGELIELYFRKKKENKNVKS